MQQPGKLRIKDLKDAIAKSRAEREEEELAVKARRSSPSKKE